MTIDALDWVIIAAYMLISLGIGLYYRSKATSNLSEFFLSGRKLPWYIAGVSMIATTFAADTPLAVNELVYTKGISGNWIWWSFVIGGMGTVFFFSKQWRRAMINTDLEFISIRYSGKEARSLRLFKAGYLGLFMNSLIMGWVNLALITILQIFFGLEEQEALLYVAGAMVLTAGYSALSGLWGVAITDAFQFILAMTGCIVLAVLVLQQPAVGGIAGMREKLEPTGALNFFPTFGKEGESGGSIKEYTIGILTFISFIGVQWWAAWYPGAEPGGGGYVAQRMMSAKNERHSLWATLMFQLGHYCLRPWPWIIVGLGALLLYPNMPADHAKEGYVMAMRDLLPVGLKGLLLVAFFAAYMSTIATQLNWGTSYIINDLYKVLRPEEKDEKKLVGISQWFTIVSMAVALIVTTQFSSIKDVWSFVINCGAGIGAVLMLRWYWWRINVWSEWTATLAPFVGLTIAKGAGMKEPYDFLFTTAFTTVSWIVATYLTKPEPEAVLKSFYSRVQPYGWWKPVAQKLGIDQALINRPFPWLFGCWLAATGLTISTLILTGKIILGLYVGIESWIAGFIVSLVLLIGCMRNAYGNDPSEEALASN